MKVKFVPQDKEFEVRPNQTVLQLAQEHDIHIKSVCKGIPSCAECRVRVVEGEHNVLPPSSKELQLIGTSYFIDQRRLSCQLRCFGDVTIDLAEQIEKAETAVAKRPRGPSRKTPEESHAVLGSIVLEEMNEAVNLQNEAPASPQAPRGATSARSSQKPSGKPNGSFYSEWTDAKKKGQQQGQQQKRHRKSSGKTGPHRK